MEDHADARRGGQTQSRSETKGMKEGQNAHDAIVLMQKEHLVHLLNVRCDVVMGKHHALWFARGAAGKYDRGNVIERGRSSTKKFRQQVRWEQGGGERGEPA